MSNEVRLIDANAAMDIATLTDWYISSVSGEPPVWTDEHIEELFNDFYVILKDTPFIEAEPVRHSRKIAVETADECMAVLLDHYCSECGSLCTDTDKYCAECGAKMDGDTT